MLGDETLYIGHTAAGKMRPGDAEMVQELGEARLGRMVPDGTDGGCYGRSPYSGIGTNNAWIGIQDRSSSLRRAAVCTLAGRQSWCKSKPARSALHDTVEFLRPLVGRVALEPYHLDRAAALRRRRLLVLAGQNCIRPRMRRS